MISFLQHALTDTATKIPFDPMTTCKQECLITTFQDVYFYTDTFEEAKEQMRYVKCLVKRYGVVVFGVSFCVVVFVVVVVVVVVRLHGLSRLYII